MSTSRTLHLVNPHMKGEDVKEAQQLLKHHGYYTGPIDGEFGIVTGNACKEAKYQLGYATKDIKATYGNPLSGLLDGTIKLPAAYRVRQRLRRRKVNRLKHREAQIRAGIVANLRWMLSEHAKKQEHYAQIRPIEGTNRPRTLPLHFDCSGSTTDAYNWTPKAKDPNNEGFNGEGYTGTVMTSPLMVQIHASQVKPGDLGILGNYPGDHQICALEASTEANNNDPNVFSMGKEGDPREGRASEFLSIGPLRWYTMRKW